MAEKSESVGEMADSLVHLATIIKQREIEALLKNRLDIIDVRSEICDYCCLLTGGGGPIDAK